MRLSVASRGAFGKASTITSAFLPRASLATSASLTFAEIQSVLGSWNMASRCPGATYSSGSTKISSTIPEEGARKLMIPEDAPRPEPLPNALPRGDPPKPRAPPVVWLPDPDPRFPPPAHCARHLPPLPLRRAGPGLEEAALQLLISLGGKEPLASNCSPWRKAAFACSRS